MGQVVTFYPDFKLLVNGKFEYVVNLEEELYCEEGDYESGNIRVTADGSLYFTVEDYFVSDHVEQDIDGVALYRECVRRDGEFEDCTAFAQEAYDREE